MTRFHGAVRTHGGWTVHPLRSSEDRDGVQGESDAIVVIVHGARDLPLADYIA